MQDRRPERALRGMLTLVVSGWLAMTALGAPPSTRPGPDAALSLILGRPSDHGITLSVLAVAALDLRLEYGLQAGTYSANLPPRALAAGVPGELELTGLAANTRYFYRVWTRPAAGGEFRPGPEGSFQTQRLPGSTFTFAVQGDSHPEREGLMYDPALYLQTLRRVAGAQPDFYFLLGDDFSIERLIARGSPRQGEVNEVYARQRSFLGEVGRTVPLFLVNGNHEQAARYLLDGSPYSPAILAGRARIAFFPLPVPDAFYSGDSEPIPQLGLPRDYYAWTWGDALFVVLDPYWHSNVAVANEAGVEAPPSPDAKALKKRDLWNVTLGDAQYRWLAKTLTASPARWKFVFCHHVLGTGRGGVEMASLGEWGGRDRQGRDVFSSYRPTWEMPIHELFVRSGVTVFFQGHDHLYARQERDGVVYQSVPNPADSGYQAFNRDAYRSGEILPNSGHLRVTVAPAAVQVDYLRSWLPKDAGAAHPDGELAASYRLHPRPPTK